MLKIYKYDNNTFNIMIIKGKTKCLYNDTTEYNLLFSTHQVTNAFDALIESKIIR